MEAQQGTPDAATLRHAILVNLGRHPATPAARRLADDVATRIGPHLARERAVGAKGVTTLAQHVGLVLAGVMRPGWQGVPVRAQRSSSGSMWQGAAIGRDRFWSITEAMVAAELLGVLDGVKTPEASDGAGYGGKATALWPTAVLLDLARAHGATADTRRADWTADATMLAKPGRVAVPALVTCLPILSVPLGLTDAMGADLAAMRASLQRINAHNAAADVRGAGHTVALVRRFRHSLGFHGRFYGPAYLTQSPAERQRITINGEAVAEVDVKASQLTVLLGMTGQREVDGDPYAVPGLARSVVKRWVIQTLGSGRPAARWSDTAPPDARKVQIAAVWEALRPHYPFLADLPALVPADLLATVPADRRHWAAGQYLVQREAAMIAGAMGYCVGRGVPVLPVHDALIVPVSRVDAAKAALHGAYWTLGGVRPRLVVSTPSA